MTQQSDIPEVIQESSLISLSPPAKTASSYSGLDKMAMLVSSLGTLRLALMNAVNTHSSLDAVECTALAAFVTLLEEQLEQVMDELYSDRPKSCFPPSP